jgi:hypothetical protein
VGQRSNSGDAHRPPQAPRLPNLSQKVDWRHLLEVLAVSVADLVDVAEHRRAMSFREPDGRTEVVDMGVGEQDRTNVVHVEP